MSTNFIVVDVIFSGLTKLAIISCLGSGTLTIPILGSIVQNA